ncbi:MAG: protein kinase, partial [Oscillospiraceae bacterium]
MVKRCFGCMNPLESDVCKKCGHNNSDLMTTNAKLLKPGTIIKDRYYIGLPIDQNGEGVTYIGYDNTQNEKVRIREFFPDTLCHRDEKTDDVLCKLGFEIQYKSLMTDFVELSRQLIGITANNSLLKAREVLTDNSTIYTVYEDIEGVKLTEYLRDNAGELGWEETENLFLPLLYTVKLLNSNGIIHRGISPETIVVTTNHELKLCGICTSAVRAINSEVTAELFLGYAAPEQYQKCTSHGEWTDVYSISAVLYKTLTGTMPQRADMRDIDDEVMKPRQLNPNIPMSVSEAIANGLGYSKSNRTAYVKDLIGELYAVPVPIQPVNIHTEFEEEPTRSKFRLPIWLIVILVALPIMLILFFVAYNIVLGGDSDNTSSTGSVISSDITSEDTSSMPTSSKETSSSVPTVVVVDFVGKLYDDVITNELYTKMFKFKDKLEVYDETLPIGEIINQDIAENKRVAEGTEIELTVSKGSQFVTLPTLTDRMGVPITPEFYKAFLV